MNSNLAENNKHELIERVETIQSILARDHTPSELQDKVTELFGILAKGNLLEKGEIEIEIAILYSARNKIRDLLAHNLIKSDKYSETRNTLAKIRKMIHPLNYISGLYNYKPLGDQPEKVRLGIDWDSVDSEKLFGDLASKFDQIDHNHPGAQKYEQDGTVLYTRIPLIRSKLQADSDGLELIGQKIDDRVRDEVTFGFAITDDQSEDAPASFRFHQVKRGGYDEWDMKHREVLGIYRGQGIASKMIDLFEGFLEKMAKETGVPQVITADTAQADVLTLLIKEGFEPSTPEDRGKIMRLFNNDGSLTVVSGPDIEGKIRPEWYIFDKNEHCDESGNVRSEIWQSYAEEPEEFLNRSFRIHLKKEISVN